MPVRILLAIYGLVLTEFVLLIASSVAFLCLLRWRHTTIWRSLGSPWFSYMQSFLKPRTREFARYIRNGHYHKLPDSLTRHVGGLMQFQLRFGAWILITLGVVGMIVMWASRFADVS
jgi:hypothetical protein